MREREREGGKTRESCRDPSRASRARWLPLAILLPFQYRRARPCIQTTFSNSMRIELGQCAQERVRLETAQARPNEATSFRRRRFSFSFFSFDLALNLVSPSLSLSPHSKLRHLPQVYRAQTTAGKRPCAIKVCNLECIPDSAALDMLLREASLMRSLNHPNVLRLHSAFLVDDSAWLVLPLVAGGCVSSALERRARRMSGSHASSSSASS